MRSALFSMVRLLFFIFLGMGTLGALAAAFLIFHVSSDLPKLPQDLRRIIEMPQTRIYSSSGQVLMNLGEQKSIPISMVSKDFINAILATEDHLFFDHHGVNKLRTLKGLYVTLFKPGRVEGASTITQQLAKNLFFSFEQSFKRKFQEMLIAFQIEAAHSKEEILEAYINQIHFGAGAQGIEKAANTFFNKPAQDLTLAQAALLAGLPKSPTAYNPFLYYDRALKRRKIVLDRMVAVGFIDREEALRAAEEKPVLHSGKKDSRSGSYFLDALIQHLIEIYGENLVFHGGLRVFSTLDTRLQASAGQALKQGLERLDSLMGIGENEKDRPQGALVAVENGTGAVRALAGGRDYFTSEFNRAVNSHRQPGSGFKPFVYYTAFKKLGLHPGSPMTDRPVRIPVPGRPDWEPRNFEKVCSGDMVLKTALTRSVNTIAAQLVQMTGPDAVIETARLCGVKSELQKVYSIALGTSGVTPLEMASAFSVFANLGTRHDPFLVQRVEDPLGRVLFEHIVQDRLVLEPAVAYQVVDMMKAVVDTGSGRSIRRSGFLRPAAGKTGTSDNYKDAWFTGFTPGLTTSVWTGFDKKKTLRDAGGRGITGGRGAAPIWSDFMSRALKGEPERDFPIPDHIRFEKIDVATGCAPAPETDPENPVSVLTIPLKTNQNLCGEP
ncbi:transglycosylase domain-containing protein [Desulfospira joergensenii]|uniref:transglycosylase domain-containing protein n=1 Tax=Desulfospira joergensenii TaxID=53329 RepID=UPI0003B4B1AF|nr:PBP1A family penicillin-binding protein [Desulfospira joergensenii]